MRLEISMEEMLPVPIGRVWHALTDPEMLERWLMKADGYEASVGASFTLRDQPREDCRGEVECEVLELAPPHRMVWSWRGAEDPATTRLVIELTETDQGTRLTLRHTGDADERTVTGTTGGWISKLEALRELLNKQRGGEDE